MSEERWQVLRMLQEGTITAEQAMELLSAMESEEDLEEIPEEVPQQEALVGEIVYPEQPPDMNRYRRFWQYPFFIALGFLILFGLWLRSIYQTSDGAITFGFVCLWSFFVFTFLLTLLAFLSRRAAWLHVRVREKSGHRVAISLPLPLGLADWGVKFAQNFVDEATQDKLDMASTFIGSARENLRQPGSEPLMINVDDDDGDQVEVYIG